jgi:hypothetical protein
MFFKKRIQIRVYKMYLNSVNIQNISAILDLNEKDVNEIIDYLNETYN